MAGAMRIPARALFLFGAEVRQLPWLLHRKLGAFFANEIHVVTVFIFKKMCKHLKRSSI